LPTTALFSSALPKLNQTYLKRSNDTGFSNRMKTAASSCPCSCHSSFSAEYNGFCVLTVANTPSTTSQFTALQSCTRNFTAKRSVTLTFRHRASCILGQALHYSPEKAFYIFNQQIYFII